MSADHPAPAEVRALAAARAAARIARAWPEADRLRGEIEAAGWRVVDHGTGWQLRPLHPPDVDRDGRTLHGTSASVPSRLDEPPAATATVVLIATDRPGDLARTLVALRATAPAGTQVVVVADGPSPEQEASLLDPAGPLDGAIGGADPEVVWTSQRLGGGGAADCGIRRAAGPVVILLSSSLEPTGDLVTPLVGCLADPTVALAGATGTSSLDLLHPEVAPPGDVDALDPGCVAFRRADYVERGPLDERFRSEPALAAWWSLVLRDAGEGRPPRRAIRLAGLPLATLPLAGREEAGSAAGREADRDRQERRDRYRLLERFGARPDLLVRVSTSEGRSEPSDPADRP